MTNCSQCGRESAEGDGFCPGCGSYLGWEEPGARPDQTGEQPPVTPEEPSAAPPAPGSAEASAGGRSEPVHAGELPPLVAPPVPPSPQARSHVRLELDDDRLLVGPDKAVTEVRLRNLGDVVDEFAVDVAGVPTSWVGVDPATVAVYPGDEARVTLTVEVPADEEVLAGEQAVQIVARSGLGGGAVAAQDAVVVIAPVTLLGLRVEPERQTSACAAEFGVTIHNRSNHEVTADITTSEPQHRLHLRVQPSQLHLQPYSEGTATVRAEAPGDAPPEPRPYPFRVLVAEAELSRDAGASAAAEAALVHRAERPAPAPPLEPTPARPRPAPVPATPVTHLPTTAPRPLPTRRLEPLPAPAAPARQGWTSGPLGPGSRSRRRRRVAAVVVPLLLAVVAAVALGSGWFRAGEEPALPLEAQAEDDVTLGGEEDEPDPAGPAEELSDTPFWTVVVASLRQESNVARVVARVEAAGHGDEVFAFRTDRFSNLTPGFWAVTVGAFATREQAEDRRDVMVGDGFGDAFARCVGSASECTS